MADRTVVVTGASTGIGRATVAMLVAAGFQVYATVRTEDDRDGLIAEFGPPVTPLIMDLLDEDSVRAAGAEVCAAGPLFGLINNAGAALPGPLEYLPIEVFRRQLEIGLTGQLLVTQVMLPALRRSAEETGDARIVMIGSVGGRISRAHPRRVPGGQARAGRPHRSAAGRIGAVRDQGDFDRAGRRRHPDLESRSRGR